MAKHRLEDRGAEWVEAKKTWVQGLLCFVRKPYKEIIGQGRYGTR